MDRATASTSATPDRWTEDLRLLAVRGVNFGRALCTCKNVYHVTWPIFRGAGYKVALKREEPVLGPIIARHIGNRARILIGGSADTGVVCVVGRATGHHRTEITVLDRCAAPLRAIDAFAAERDLPITTMQADLQDLDAVERWDIALLHYTLWYVEPQRRLDVLRRLGRALAKGGRLVCCVRQGLGKAPEDSAALAAAWLDDVRSLVAKAELDLPLTANELDDLLRASRTETFERATTIPTAEELKRLLPKAGFVLTEETDTTAHLSPGAARAGARPAESGSILTAVRL